MGVTIKQIAEMAGVHRSTVDKVLHHREGVSDEVRKKVQRIIDECNYQANPIGKALKMQDKVIQLGIILLKVDALPHIKQGIEKELEQYSSFQIQLEYQVIEYSDEASQAKIMQTYREQKKDGIIITPLNAQKVLEEIDLCEQANIPVVTINTDIKNSKRLCFIGQDGFKAGKIAGRLMGEFLSGLGKVAVFSSELDKWQSFPFGAREAGFREIVNQYYPAVKILPSIMTGENPQVISREVKKILQEQPDINAVYITCGGVKEAGTALKETGNENVRLICYENYPEILRLLEEGVVTATIDSKIVEQGMKSISILMDYLIYDKRPDRKHCYTEIVVMVRESL